MLGELMAQMEMPAAALETDQRLDSLPIGCPLRGPSTHAKVTRDHADKGYCESKKLWSYGVKLHLLGAKQYHRLPVALSLCLTEASRHDLPVLKQAVLAPFARYPVWRQSLPRSGDETGALSTGHDDLYTGQETETTASLQDRPQRVIVSLRFRDAATDRVNVQLVGGKDRH